jgi:hypothetical protein
MLLPFEERYLEYLYQNDFNITNEVTSSRIKKQEKNSEFITKADTITFIISIIFGVLIQFFIGSFVESKIEENYILLKSSEFPNFISLFVFVIALYLILMYPIKSLAIKLRKNDKVDLLSSNKKAYIILALVGIIILFNASTYSYLNYQKNVGIGENDIYYCDKIGNVEKLQYDDVKFYLVDDNEFEDETPYYYRRIVVVKGNDYENYVLSDYLGETGIDYAKLNEIGVEKTFDSLDDFCNEFNIENQYD